MNTVVPRHVAELIRGMADVEEMLGANIVQGKLNDSGNYGTALTPTLEHLLLFIVCNVDNCRS